MTHMLLFGDLDICQLKTEIEIINKQKSITTSMSSLRKQDIIFYKNRRGKFTNNYTLVVSLYRKIYKNNYATFPSHGYC